MKNIKILIMYISLYFYYELLFKILIFSSTDYTLVYILLYGLFVSSCLFCLNLLFPYKWRQLFLVAMTIINFIWYSVQYVVYKIFNLFVSVDILTATDQIKDFTGDIFGLLINHLGYLLLFAIPIPLVIIFRKKVIELEVIKPVKVLSLVLMFITICLFIVSLNYKKNEDYSAYRLYYQYHDVTLSMRKLGVINALHQDIIKSTFSFKEDIVLVNSKVDDDKEDITIYDYNNLDIDFSSLESNDIDIELMNTYFSNESGTKQNEYTGYFEGMNLIYIMAESFSDIAVDESRTPTLYKLINEGFNFNNFYSPTISSTIGGEFQLLMGLYPTSGFLDTFRSGNNTYPYGLGTMFRNEGYTNYAYHNNAYAFQDRHLYMPSIGFDNYTGCYNGMEKLIDCSWLASDVDMISATTPLYLNSEDPFVVFYATVSGHGEYTLNHEFPKKYAHLVEGDYPDSTKAYLASQIELDRALEKLIYDLEVSGKLDDTVIVMAGDHYPYYLSNEEINAASDYYKDPDIEVSRSNLIIWNSNIDNVEIDKVSSQIDILPTVYNLFGLNYDSRVIIGKDILSTEGGLAIFGSRSWVSDYGSYNAITEEFIPRDNILIDGDYVSYMNSIVSTKITMSGLIMTKDYYKILGGK